MFQCNQTALVRCRNEFHNFHASLLFLMLSKREHEVLTSAIIYFRSASFSLPFSKPHSNNCNHIRQVKVIQFLTGNWQQLTDRLTNFFFCPTFLHALYDISCFLTLLTCRWILFFLFFFNLFFFFYKPPLNFFHAKKLCSIFFS